MARPYTGKRHTGERREKRKNGDVYVYTRVTEYDKATGKTRTVEEKLVGKIKAGTTEIVPTRPKRRKGEAAPVVSERKHTGLMDILEWAGRESGIDRDVKGSFSQGEALKLLSIARYWIATDGCTLPRMEGWQIMHDLPYPGAVSEDVYCDLFKSIGRNEDGIQRYFRHRASKLSENPVIALDSTTISTYSENLSEARHGFNKDGDNLPVVKLVTAYSVLDEEPIAYAKQPGNVPDVISVENALEQLRALGIDTPLTVTDAGYCSEHNLAEYSHRNMKFLTIMNVSAEWRRNIVDELRDELEKMSSVCPFDITVSGATKMAMHEFQYMRKRSRNGIEAGEKVAFKRRLYYHVFYSESRKLRQLEDFKAGLLLLKRQLEGGSTEFSKMAEQRIEKYLHVSRTTRNQACSVTFNDEAIKQEARYFGHFMLVSNQALDTFKALEYYRLREKIEEFFKDDKETVDGRRPRVWTSDNLRGRQFAQFIGLGYYCFITKRLRQVRKELEMRSEGETEAERKRKAKLGAWMDARSFAQIMDWFDCIETTSIKNERATFRWTTEKTEQDRLLLKMLGVID